MTQKLNDYLTALARTVVPMVVGVVVTFALKHGANLRDYTPVITACVSAGYYAVVHLLERYVTPKFGWLLGVAKVPSYPVAAPSAPTAPSIPAATSK